MLLNDMEISARAVFKEMVKPFHEAQVDKGIISYGVGSYGYDARLGYVFKVFDNLLAMHAKTVDPKNKCWHEGFTSYRLDEIPGQQVIIPANSFALAESLEEFTIPRDVLCICLGKSTYARCGIIVNVTPLEPEWQGKITIEISNTTPLPAIVYAGEGIVQILFLKASEVCQVSYADKKGKYNLQKGLTLPCVKEGGS